MPTKKPLIRLHDLATGEIIDREMTDDEYAEHQLAIAAAAAKDAADAEALAKREAMIAALAAAAGLDPDDVAQALGV